MTHGHQIKSYTNIINFAFGGHCTITLRSPKTGTRFTYSVKQAKDEDNNPKDVYFVALLNGPNNDTDYQFLGIAVSKGVEVPVYRHGRKSKVSKDASSVRAFDFFLKTLMQKKEGDEYTAVEVWHEGRCGRCNRKLTVPESIEIGLGPECASKM